MSEALISKQGELELGMALLRLLNDPKGAAVELKKQTDAGASALALKTEAEAALAKAKQGMSQLQDQISKAEATRSLQAKEDERTRAEFAAREANLSSRESGTKAAEGAQRAEKVRLSQVNEALELRSGKLGDSEKALADRQSELDKREAELEESEAELLAKQASLAKKLAAVSALQEEVA